MKVEPRCSPTNRVTPDPLPTNSSEFLPSVTFPYLSLIQHRFSISPSQCLSLIARFLSGIESALYGERDDNQSCLYRHQSLSDGALKVEIDSEDEMR